MTARKYVPKPEHVFVGNHTYRIEWMSNDEWDTNRLDPEADALTFARRQLIIVRTYEEANESHYQEVLWHEITHACWDTTMLTHTALGEQKDPEEFVVGLQSPAQVFVLRHNPELVKWLMSDRG